MLKEVAERLRKATRAGDVIARYGGKEFAILLPHADHADHAQIVAVAERVRQSVAATPFEVDDETRLNVTVSIGVALAPEGNASPDTLTLAADQRLYAAKAGGRNRVEWSAP